MSEPRVLLVAPWPPPEGGMSVQARGLARALEAAGTPVTVVPTNVGLGWIGRIRGVRGVINLAIYLARLAWAMPKADVVHILAASGLTFFLFTAPAVALGRIAGRRVVVNYRGGLAESFLASRGRWVRMVLRRAHRLVVPSGFLEAVFSRHGYAPVILPNYIDLGRFAVEGVERRPRRVLVTRNLEPIYNIEGALDAFRRVRERFPDATLCIAGDGSLRASLEAKAGDGVEFLGRVDNERIPALYAEAAVTLNPTNVDNMPISILEAYASGTPVVSTDAGGVPFVVKDGETGLLAPVGDAPAMAACLLRVLEDEPLAARLVENARAAVADYALPAVVAAWQSLYREQVARA